jgi:hypothetical protein
MIRMIRCETIYYNHFSCAELPRVSAKFGSKEARSNFMSGEWRFTPKTILPGQIEIVRTPEII